MIDQTFKNNSVRKILRALSREYKSAKVSWHAGNTHTSQRAGITSTTLLDGTITFSMNLNTQDPGWDMTLREVEGIIEAEGGALRHEVVAAYKGAVSSHPDGDFQYFQITLYYPHSSRTH